MDRRKESNASSRESGSPERLLVEVAGAQRPFMRGIMVHSLMARGVSFEDAYRTAEEVRERVQGRGVVSSEELAKLAETILGQEALSEHASPASLPES